MGEKPLNVGFGVINEQNVEQLRKLNSSCFPVSYNDAFYREVVQQQNEDLSKFAYWNGFIIGAVCTRVESSVDRPGRRRLYIMTLGVLAAYRNRGVGSKLIASVLEYFDQNKNGELSDVDEITLHVQTSNVDAMNFYIKGFGFEKGEMVKNYYKRIDPPDCFVLSKKLR
mmetsp:Transcript_47671/g.57723  ORF Transcript_47671/g.57723 Transcript_47671/m.57723 type:complete len:169 (+) Transcript_47671:239-745(+)